VYRGGGGEISAPEAGDLMRILQKLPLLPGRTQVGRQTQGIFGYCVLDINTRTRGHQAGALSLDPRDKPVSNTISPRLKTLAKLASGDTTCLPGRGYF